MAGRLDALLMEGGRRYEDSALLTLRTVTGLFLIYQSHDNLLAKRNRTALA